MPDEVDFPIFVPELIEGAFDAIVDVSIQQMAAYADLPENVVSCVDECIATAAPASGRSRQPW